MRRKVYRVLFALLAFILGFQASFSEAALFGASEGAVSVENVTPEVSSLTVTPNRTDTYYNVTFTVRDNNTLNDVSEITVVVWDKATSTYNAENNETNHYTFKWNSTVGWFEEDLTGHLVNSTEPTNLSIESATWSIRARFSSDSVVGNYTVRVIVDDGLTSSYREAYVIRDRIDVYYFEVSTSEVEVGQPVNVYVQARLAYDNHTLGLGD